MNNQLNPRQQLIASIAVASTSELKYLCIVPDDAIIEIITDKTARINGREVSTQLLRSDPLGNLMIANHITI